MTKYNIIILWNEGTGADGSAPAGAAAALTAHELKAVWFDAFLEAVTSLVSTGQTVSFLLNVAF